MRLLAYLAFSLAFPCVFWKFEVGNALGFFGGGELHSLVFCGTLTAGIIDY